MSQSYGKNDPYRPFSNGTEHMTWLESNCMRGARGCRKYNPNATSSRHGCPIECAITLGNMSASIALRAGFLEPGPDGRLVPVDADLPYKIIPKCPEYKGYDEPDDRPKRGPRPPKEQLDLLDPRNAPNRPRVAA